MNASHEHSQHSFRYPVSYTHLDVYKRQSVTGSNSSLGGGNNASSNRPTSNSFTMEGSQRRDYIYEGGVSAMSLNVDGSIAKCQKYGFDLNVFGFCGFDGLITNSTEQSKEYAKPFGRDDVIGCLLYTSRCV